MGIWTVPTFWYNQMAVMIVRIFWGTQVLIFHILRNGIPGSQGTNIFSFNRCCPVVQEEPSLLIRLPRAGDMFYYFVPGGLQRFSLCQAMELRMPI